jgi:hypothetical protein
MHSILRKIFVLTLTLLLSLTACCFNLFYIDTFLQIILPPSRYAPLVECDPPTYMNTNSSGIIPGSYSVHLKPGVTLAQHYAAVGTNMSKYFTRRSGAPDELDLIDGMYYVVEGVGDALLWRVRKDEGVYEVECDSWFVGVNSIGVDDADNPVKHFDKAWCIQYGEMLKEEDVRFGTDQADTWSCSEF